MRKIILYFAFLAVGLSLNAQNVKQVRFCDKKYEYGAGKDSITLYLSFLDSNGKRITNLSANDLENYLVIYENEHNLIPNDRRKITTIKGGQRIPNAYTFSVLVDLSMPDEGKAKIFDVIGSLINSAPDSCVYLSFFGDDVTSSQLVTKKNYDSFKSYFLKSANNKYLWDALYAKLIEFGGVTTEKEGSMMVQSGYVKNPGIQKRAKANADKIILVVFTEGSRTPDETDTGVAPWDVSDFQNDRSHIAPKIYALYYTGNGFNEDVENALTFITTPRDSAGIVLVDRQGAYKPSDKLDDVLTNFEQVVEDAMYDYAFIYKVKDGQFYFGSPIDYVAEWKGAKLGNGTFSIGTEEKPWPTRVENASDTYKKFLIAFLVALLTIVFFFVLMKIIIPLFKSKSFAFKYYKKYEPETNVQRRICYYCKQDIQPGQKVVVRCEHIMHVHCWHQNGYKCAEYGQKCKIGVQDHIHWKELLTRSSIRDCYQTISGIFAGLISWIIYELMGRGGFDSIATIIVKTFFANEVQRQNLFDTCVVKVSAFLAIGVLLGFFLSLIFRHNDEYRKKDWKIYLKFFGLSVLSGIIGMAAFALGGILLCLLLSILNLTYIPWYCSLPSYLLFSIFVSLSLTIKSSIPIKSAMLGGMCSAIIGFLVLYFSSFTSSRYEWMNMLLDFVIYGGGLGASLVTVRMLAEKYFLVIQNGIKAGQKIPIHKWMNATGGGNKVSLGMTGECEIQMNWEKSNKVAKEHAQLYIDHVKSLPMIKPLATGVIYNTRAELSVGKPVVLSNGDTFQIGDTTFLYVETD